MTKKAGAAMRFILASSSPRRREIIGSMIEDFEIIKPDIDESQGAAEAPLDYVKRLSQEKAQAVAAKIEGESAILAADTVVILAADTIGIAQDGEILGKPSTAEEARTMLQRLRNRPHLVCTAFTLLRGEEQHSEIVTTTVYMRDYSDAEIDAYIATGDPFDKAGSYAIQHEAFHPVSHIEGSYSNVVGLPADEVKAALGKLNIPMKAVES
jgi:septum formation protein